MKLKELQKVLNEAIELAEQDKLPEAREKFDLLENECAEDPQILYNVAIFRSQEGEHLKASELLHKVCEAHPDNAQFLTRTAMEDFHIGGGQVFQSDFLGFDASYLLKAKEACEKAMEIDSNPDAAELLHKIESTVTKNKCAFRFLEGDLDYCRRILTRKRELTPLDERLLGFLNLLDTGEYEYVKGHFNVYQLDDLPKSEGGFLDRIRNWVLGK